MKRARKNDGKKRNIRSEIKRKGFSGYSSDMLDLGYDPDTFKEDEEELPKDAEAVENTQDLSNAEELSETATEETEREEQAEELPESEENEINEENEEISESEKAPRPTRKKRTKLLIFSVALVTILALFAAVLGFGGLFADKTGEIEEDYVVPVDKGTGKINVLVLGADKDGMRTDTVILASYDLDSNTVKLLSIPRDTRMYVGNKYQKINAAHAISQSGKIKGPQGSIEAVTRLTSIPINYYVEFSFDAFKNTIDALGGLDFDVPQNMNYEDPAQDLYIHLKKGFQHLDGDKAEQLVRFRRYPMGDIGRVEMQQAFIKELAAQKLNMSIIGRLPDLYNVLKDDIDTNFTLLDVTKYANNLKELSPENITMFQLPGAFGGGEYTVSYWIADMDATKTLIETEFGYDASKATIHSEDGSSLSKESADRRATRAPKASASTTKEPTKTHKATSEPTNKPTHTAAATHSAKPSATHTPVPEATKAPTHKPTEEPTKTEAPSKTEAPAAEKTKKPARPTPNTAAE